MTDRKSAHMIDHADEDQILRSLVDETGLPSEVREHLRSCPTCMAGRERMEARLARLASLARHYSPKPERKVLLPETGAPQHGGWFRRWRLHPGWLPDRLDFKMLGTAMAAVLVAFSSLLLVGTLPEGGNGLTGLTKEMNEDYQLMTEVGVLEENPLPDVYISIAGGDDPGSAEDLDSVTPSPFPGDDSTSQSNDQSNNKDSDNDDDERRKLKC